jgi:hypothetical protein
MRLRKNALLLIVILALVACSEQEQQLPVYQVTLRDFDVSVPAFGELESEEAQLVTAPGRRPMTIAWLVEENSFVKKGDIVARFDPDKLIKDSRTEELEMFILRQDIVKSQAQQKQQLSDIDAEQQMVSEEFRFTDKFAVDDVRLYSKLEIIDTLQNRDFLNAKDDFLDWKEGSIDRQTESAIDVLTIREQGHNSTSSHLMMGYWSMRKIGVVKNLQLDKLFFLGQHLQNCRIWKNYKLSYLF